MSYNMEYLFVRLENALYTIKKLKMRLDRYSMGYVGPHMTFHFQCDSCGIKTRTQREMVDHLKRLHEPGVSSDNGECQFETDHQRDGIHHPHGDDPTIYNICRGLSKVHIGTSL